MFTKAITLELFVYFISKYLELEMLATVGWKQTFEFHWGRSGDCGQRVTEPAFYSNNPSSNTTGATGFVL